MILVYFFLYIIGFLISGRMFFDRHLEHVVLRKKIIKHFVVGSFIAMLLSWLGVIIQLVVSLIEYLRYGKR